MKECNVPGLAGDVCREIELSPQGTPYCFFAEAATLESSESVYDFEGIVRKNKDLCPQIETAQAEIEKVKNTKQ